jgi:lactoylglutathione lyase
MKLNHLNLTVTDVAAASAFLEKHFGLRSMGPPTPTMAGLRDDNGLVLTVMRAGKDEELRYPGSFHVGFTQETPEEVNEIHRRLTEDGLDAPAPRRMHGAWTFYFQAPGGFTIEVGA